MEYRQLPVGVIQICCIAPGPVISAMVYVSLDLMSQMDLLSIPVLILLQHSVHCHFQVAIPPLPGSPVGFSGLIDLVFALLKRKRFPGLMFNPLNPEVFCAFAIEEIKIME